MRPSAGCIPHPRLGHTIELLTTLYKSVIPRHPDRLCCRGMSCDYVCVESQSVFLSFKSDEIYQLSLGAFVIDTCVLTTCPLEGSKLGGPFRKSYHQSLCSQSSHWSCSRLAHCCRSQSLPLHPGSRGCIYPNGKLQEFTRVHGQQLC